MKPKLYGLTTCPYCRAMRKYLNKYDVDFEDVTVDTLPEEEKKATIKRIKEKTGGTLFPILEHGDENFLIGFDKKKLIAIFDLEV